MLHHFEGDFIRGDKVGGDKVGNDMVCEHQARSIPSPSTVNQDCLLPSQAPLDKAISLGQAFAGRSLPFLA
jgi:hypothetical protein